MIEIYSAHLPAGNSRVTHEDIMTMQSEPLKKLQDEVNNSLKNNAGANVQWLQHAAASSNGHFVQLTAVVSY